MSKSLFNDLDSPQEKGAKILDHVRSLIKEGGSGDADAWFLINRWVFARLQLDERATKRQIKTQLFQSNPRCYFCGEPFDTIKNVHLHRLDEAHGYHKDNCVLLHPKCHREMPPRPATQRHVKEVANAKKASERLEAQYWLTPIKSDEKQSAEERLKKLLGEAKIYAWGERTPGRRYLKPGDWMCFYATGKGVIAHAKVASAPEQKQHPRVRHPEIYRWVFRVKDVQLYLEEPIVIDADLRAQLDAFQDKDPNRSWAWFVWATRRINGHDFVMLTRGEA